MKFERVLLMIIVMAAVTYLIRMLPFVIFRKKIKSEFIQSFLYYIPYGVLSAMTLPYIFYSTGSIISATVGTIVAVLLALKDKSLILVAVAASVASFVTVYATDFIMNLIK